MLVKKVGVHRFQMVKYFDAKIIEYHIFNSRGKFKHQFNFAK
jgi:hypothetical protein